MATVLIVIVAIAQILIVGLAGILRPRYCVYIAVGLVCFFVLLFVIDNTLTHHPDELWRVSIFLGSVLITIGWMVTNEISLSNSRKQHTINLITDYISGNRHVADRKLIRKKLPNRETKLTPKLVSFGDENSSLTQAIDRELNFFEFTAIGLKSGDLDGSIVKDALQSNLCDFYRQMEDYISYWREKDFSTWEHLSALYTRWN